MDRIRSLCSYALATLLLISSLAASPSPSVASGGAPTQQAARFDGRVLFEAVAFGQGPAARLFPELASIPKASPETARAIALILDQMEASAPGFFDRFGTDLYSGDRVRVRSALERGVKLADETISRLQAAGGSNIGIAQVFVFQAAVLLFLAVAAIIVLVGEAAVAVNRVVTISSAMSEESSLVRDRWADRIVRTLTP